MKQLFIIKIGGNIIDDEDSLNVFLRNFASIKEPKLLVHGGGRIATRIGEKLGIESKYINGRRITDKETIDLVTMVYGGLVNKKIVAGLQAFGCNAIGLTGADANTIPATKRPVRAVDFGYVGDIENGHVETGNWQLFIENDLVPVMAPLTHDGKGQLLNTNADTIASVLAVSLSRFYHVRLIYCFEKKGVLKDVEDDKSVIPEINSDSFKELAEQHALSAGILPKLENAFEAIHHGVNEIIIGHADDLLCNVSDEMQGTLIKS